MTIQKIDKILKDTLKELRQLYKYIANKYDRDNVELFKSEPTYKSIMDLEGLNARLSGLELQSNKFQIMYHKVRTLLQVRYNLEYDDCLVSSFFIKYLRGHINYIQVVKGHKQIRHIVG